MAHGNDSPSANISVITKTRSIMQHWQGYSWVWTPFSKNTDSNSIVCAPCTTAIQATSYNLSSSTSTLVRQLWSFHSIYQFDESSTDATQLVFTPSGIVHLHELLNDKERNLFMKTLVHNVSDSKQSFFIVDQKSFARFCRTLNHRYKMAHRNILCSTIHYKYVVVLECFFQKLQSIKNKLSLTANGCSSHRMHGYLLF